MSRRPNGSGRYYVTLEGADADALEAAARAQGRPPTTEAGLRIVQTLRAESAGARDALASAVQELAEARRELERVRGANATLRRRLSQPDGDREPEPPRWEWPLEDLLADRDWWRAWLPRLHQLLGRPSSHVYARDGENPVDARGYVDVMATLLPPVSDQHGTVIEWNSLRYAETAPHKATGRVLALPSARADVWEPVVRHVALALCDLELTAAPGANPALRIRTEEELLGPWLQTLRRLTGDTPANLPGPPG